MNGAGLLVAFGAIVAYEMPRLIRGRLWRELAVFLGMIALGLGLSWLQSMGLPTKSWAEIAGPLGQSVWNGFANLLSLGRAPFSGQ
ncbi:MAG: hypothetical protein GX998_00190 [Firmicutes bacterium]|nr:hypothetical protein [Bacillota bacterium]